jgi:hypothetical protein
MMVKHGVSAFWGYTVKFMFYHQNPPPAPLHQDKLAEAFLRMDIIVDLGILAGKSAGDIYDAVTAYVAQMLPKLSRTSRALLLDNYVHLVCPATTWDSAATVI